MEEEKKEKFVQSHLIVFRCKNNSDIFLNPPLYICVKIHTLTLETGSFDEVSCLKALSLFCSFSFFL